MINILIVSVGAGIGGGLRYIISTIAARNLPIYFPFGTLIVNTLGSFLLGLIIFGLDEKELISSNLRLFLGVGICGGFTTFSTFSLETIYLFRDSQFLFAGLNIILNLFSSLFGIVLAYYLAK